MISAGIIGATGYVGVELVRLLLAHPDVSALNLSSVSFEGQNIVDIYPNLRGFCSSTPKASSIHPISCSRRFRTE